MLGLDVSIPKRMKDIVNLWLFGYDDLFKSLNSKISAKTIDCKNPIHLFLAEIEIANL